MLRERLDWRVGIAILAVPLLVAWGGEQESQSKATWRDDATNLEVVRKLNRAHRLMPFSWEFEGVVDESPLELEWVVGRDLPLAWKGGVACPFGNEIVLTGGLWMPGRLNRTLAYHLEKGTYRELPPPPIRPQYTQGTCDDRALYVVGGRGSRRPGSEAVPGFQWILEMDRSTTAASRGGQGKVGRRRGHRSRKVVDPGRRVSYRDLLRESNPATACRLSLALGPPRRRMGADKPLPRWAQGGTPVGHV